MKVLRKFSSQADPDVLRYTNAHWCGGLAREQLSHADGVTFTATDSV